MLRRALSRRGQGPEVSHRRDIVTNGNMTLVREVLRPDHPPMITRAWALEAWTQ